jgi:thiol-disulfide isomerase/thioredoxin
MTPSVLTAAMLTLLVFGTSTTAGRPAPNFTLPTLTGSQVSLAQYRGRVVLVNFWATWCPPCRAEMPILMKLQQTFAPAGFEVLGVSVDEEGEKVVGPWVRRNRFALNGSPQLLNFPVLVGSPAVADTYGEIGSFPTSFLIGPDGTIATRVDGLVDDVEMTRLITRLLPRSPTRVPAAVDE